MASDRCADRRARPVLPRRRAARPVGRRRYAQRRLPRGGSLVARAEASPSAGRSFTKPSRAWLAGEIDDAALIAQRAGATFETLIDAWRNARGRGRRRHGAWDNAAGGSVMNVRHAQTPTTAAAPSRQPRPQRSTIRLTAAQALVRYLGRATRRRRRRRIHRPAVRRRVRDLRPRQRRRAWAKRFISIATRCPPIARTTSRRWRTVRSPTRRRISAAA